jgi:hypothetical protein
MSHSNDEYCCAAKLHSKLECLGSFVTCQYVFQATSYNYIEEIVELMFCEGHYEYIKNVNRLHGKDLGDAIKSLFNF